MIDAHLVEESFDARMPRLQAETQARWDALGTAWEAFIGLAGAGALPGVGQPELPPELATPPPNPDAKAAPGTVDPPATLVERPILAPAPQLPEELQIEFVDEPATAKFNSCFVSRVPLEAVQNSSAVLDALDPALLAPEKLEGLDWKNGLKVADLVTYFEALMALIVDMGRIRSLQR